jgi:hypothetical protein
MLTSLPFTCPLKADFKISLLQRIIWGASANVLRVSVMETLKMASLGTETRIGEQELLYIPPTLNEYACCPQTMTFV